jgi:hypothetical protein
MAYEVRPLRRFKARYDNANADNLLRVAIVRDGAKVLWVGGVGDTAHATIYAPGVVAAVATDLDLTAVSGSSVLSLALDTTTEANYPIKTGYRAEITVTIGTTVYLGQVIFDVARHPLLIPLTVDQLVARDHRLRGADWGGDDDFSEIIDACRDEIQLMIEGVETESGRTLEETVLDANKLAVPFRLYVLAAIFRGNADDWAQTAADHYDSVFKDAWASWLKQVRPDTGQAGSEGGAEPRIVQVRLHT